MPSEATENGGGWPFEEGKLDSKGSEARYTWRAKAIWPTGPQANEKGKPSIETKALDESHSVPVQTDGSPYSCVHSIKWTHQWFKPRVRLELYMHKEGLTQLSNYQVFKRW